MSYLKNKYIKLFTATFILSSCTFGGGYVIVSLMRKKFVEKLGLIEEKELIDITAIAQSSPGSIAVNASILLGYHVAGVIGALFTMLGTILPPLFVISIISFFYTLFNDNLIVGYAMKGMQAGVAAVICDVVCSMAKDVLKEKNYISYIILPFSFIAVFFFNINVVIIIVSCALIGILLTILGQRKKVKT